MAESQPILTDPVAGLVDIPLPAAVSLWPQTPTLRTVIVVVLAALIASAIWLLHRRLMNRYRREALAELDRIARTSKGSHQLAENLALLVRRTALAVFPREQVAGLSGGAWLSFLDRTYGGTEFSSGAGRSLEAATYAPTRRDEDPSLLIDLVRRWIEVHHA